MNQTHNCYSHRAYVLRTVTKGHSSVFLTHIGSETNYLPFVYKDVTIFEILFTFQMSIS